jgi:hypothetical protein
MSVHSTDPYNELETVDNEDKIFVVDVGLPEEVGKKLGISLQNASAASHGIAITKRRMSIYEQIHKVNPCNFSHDKYFVVG